MMKSKYHPFFVQLREDWIDFFSARLEGAVLFFALGLSVGLIFNLSAFWGLLGGVLLVCFFYARFFLKTSFCLLALSCFFIGTTVAYFRLNEVAHPTLKSPLFQVELKGMIENNLILPEKQILTISQISWPYPDFHLPPKVQLYFSMKDVLLQTGDKITFQASLFPLTSHLMSVASRTHSALYFQGVGATGVLHKIISRQKNDAPPSVWERIRLKITNHLLKVLPESQARIAIPLITGEQRFVRPEQYKLYRQAGLTHVLSVSGFHMALLAGFLFFLIRGFGALIMGLTLRFSVKKIAAVFAWLGTLCYLLLSGVQIPALRSFGMISLVFLGILTDRVAFSKRSLILVAAALLIYRPENILSISFQLSFLSVLVLIQTHEWLKEKSTNWGKLKRVVVEFILLNLTITLALTPLIAGYFHLINPYGFLGNLMFSTLFSLAIMPCLFMGSILIPLGGGDIFLKVAGYLLSKVESISSFLGQVPLSEIVIPSFSLLGVAFFAFGLVFFCVFHRLGKKVGYVLWGVALILILKTSLPQILIYNESISWTDTGKFYAHIYGQQGVQERWQKNLGFDKKELLEKPDFIQIKNHKIALKAKGCLGAKLALLTVPDTRCHTPTLLLKPNTFYQIFVGQNKIEVKEEDKTIKIIKS